MGVELAEILIFSAVNLVGFYLMRADKKRAEKRLFRISEKTLWIVAFLGGAMGMTWAMQIFRHKTKHLQFKFGLPILMVVQIILLAFIVL